MDRLGTRGLVGLVLASLIALAAVPTAQAQQSSAPVALRLSGTEGARAQYSWTTEGRVSFQIPEDLVKNVPFDTRSPLKFKATSLLSTSVRSADEQGMRLNMALDSIDLEASGFGHGATVHADKSAAKVRLDDETVFDSTQGELASFPIAALVFGREFLLLDFDRRADLRGITTAGLLSTVADTPALAKAFSELADLWPPILPEGNVTAGDTWRSEVRFSVPELGIAGGGALRFLYRGTTMEAGRRCASIGLRGQVGLSEMSLRELVGPVTDSGAMLLPSVPDVVLSGMAKLSGTVYLDPSTAELVRGQIDADVTARFVASELDKRARVLMRLHSVLQRVPAGPDAAKPTH